MPELHDLELPALPRLMGVSTVAEGLECSVRKVDYLCEDGELEVVYLGKQKRITSRSYEALIDRLIKKGLTDKPGRPGEKRGAA